MASILIVLILSPITPTRSREVGMNNQTVEYQPDIIEQFCGGAWYTPTEDSLRSVMPWLLSAFGSTSFAAAATTLVRLLGAA